MATQKDYIEKSIKERLCLRHIFKQFNNKYDWKWWFTDEQSYELYDALLIKFEKDSGNILEQYFIEEKVRDKHYNDLMLERIKLNKLKSLVQKYDKRNYNNKPSQIIYSNTTPNGSYWWNLSKIDLNQLEWKQELHWISTTNKSLGKELKWVTYLKTDLAKWTNVNCYIKDEKKEIKKDIINQKQTNGLYNFLFI